MPPRASLSAFARFIDQRSIRRCLSGIEIQRSALSTAELFAAQVAEKQVQVYVSELSDPYVNLSIEHYLLQKSHKGSVVLFLYVNRPSIVIGRNQNPWLEVDLKRLQNPRELYAWSANGNKIPAQTSAIDLVRRRSGGGTVFHDGGNVNYCVICPNPAFTRDKHAEMVVRAIRNGLNPRARVNERHDIVLDQGDQPSKSVDAEDMHRTVFEDHQKQPLKVSGSAYKMVKDRTLHHGTCLVNSPNLSQISGYLRSPATAHIKALGVDSVRTPVSNIFQRWQPTALHRFQANVIEQFLGLYRPDREASSTRGNPEADEDDMILSELDESHASLPEIQKGVAELRSRAWIFGQTPRFTFSSHPDGYENAEWSTSHDVQLATRSGVIESAVVDSIDQRTLVGRKIYELDGFEPFLDLSHVKQENVNKHLQVKRALAGWLDGIFAV